MAGTKTLLYAILKLHTPKEIFATVIHPQIEVKTADARSVIKQNIPLKKAIIQWGNLAGLVSALYTEDYGLLSRCLHDEIVEPMRSPLIPGFYKAKQAAKDAGALGSGISGSGPSIFALSKGEETAKKVDVEIKKIVDAGYQRAKKIITEKMDDLHKLAKALLAYETLSGEEIKDLILKNTQPSRAKEEDVEDQEESSSLGSLGLKPKPAI